MGSYQAKQQPDDEDFGSYEVFFDDHSKCWWWHICTGCNKFSQPFGPFVRREEALRHALWLNEPH